MVEVQKLEVFAIFNMLAQPPARSAWSRCKNSRFLQFLYARATRGSAWSRCKNSRFRFLQRSRDPLRGSAWSRFKNSRFLRFLTCSRDPLRGSAWSRCKNSTCAEQQSTLPGAVSLARKGFAQGKRTHPAALGQPRLRWCAFGQPWFSFRCTCVLAQKFGKRCSFTSNSQKQGRGYDNGKSQILLTCVHAWLQSTGRGAGFPRVIA